jgi:hypothetical protein
MSETPEWALSLPEELRDSGVIKSTPDIATAAKRLVDLERHRAASIALPKDSDPESLAAFEKAVQKRGFIRGEVPESPEGYEAPETDVVTKDWVASKLKEYHAIGLTKAQAKAALEREVNALKSAREGLGEADLAAIDRAAQRYNLDGSPASLIRALKEIGMAMTEDTTKPTPGQSGGLSKIDLEAKIAEINDQIVKFPSYDPRGQKLLEEKMNLLLEIQKMP